MAHSIDCLLWTLQKSQCHKKTVAEKAFGLDSNKQNKMKQQNPCRKGGKPAANSSS